MSVIWIVDDDASLRRALERLLVSEGYETRAFSDPISFLEGHDPAIPGCAIIDLGLPGLDGLALQDRIAQAGGERQVIFLTGQGSITSAVQAMRAGAVDYLTKPVEANTLFASIAAALARDEEARMRRGVDLDLCARLASLSRREREVMVEVVAGRRNKQIAHQLGAAEKTIKVHRGRMMHKMEVRSVAELVTLCSRLRDGGHL